MPKLWNGLLREIQERLGLAEFYLIDREQKGEKIHFTFGIRKGEAEIPPVEEMEKEVQERLISESLIVAERRENVEMTFLSDPKQEVAYLLNTKIQPYVKADGGGIEIREIYPHEGRIVVSLQGACSGCPSAVFTLAAGLKTTLQKSLPWVKIVQPAEEPKEPDFGFRLLKKREVDVQA